MIVEKEGPSLVYDNEQVRANHLSEPSNSRPTALAAVVSDATRLARIHLAQKHYYPLNQTDNNGFGQPHAKLLSSEQTCFDTHRNTHVDTKPTSLAVEAAVAIVINGIHYAVLMASPHQLEYLAVGFLFSEGLIHHSHELLDWEVTQLTDIADYQRFTQESIDEPLAYDIFLEQLQDYETYVVELTLNQRCHQRIQAQRRQLAGRTGCGMCGITGLTQALPDLSAYQQDKLQVVTKKPSLEYLLTIRAHVDSAQHTHQLTGAVHAAATMQDQRLYLFEDVGRHNALDKLIGWQLRKKVDVDCVIMTSRLSIELVQKSIRSQIPWLVGMSAPTSTAVRVAERYGLGLAGFLRDNRVTYYAGS